MFDLMLTACFVLLHPVLVWSGTQGFVRIVSGFLSMSVWPGYSLLALVYDLRNEEQSLLEHIALALPLSLAINTVVGLAINSLNIASSPRIQSAAICAIALSLTVAALLVRSKFAARNGPEIKSYAALISALVAVALMLSLLAFGLQLNLTANERFTSLYVLDGEGKLIDAELSTDTGTPMVLTVGGEYSGPFAEHAILSSSTGDRIDVALQPGTKWKRQVSVVPTEPGHQTFSWRLTWGAAEIERIVQVQIYAR